MKCRINAIGDFHAKFVQKLISPNGNILKINTGEFWISPPKRFYWHTILPEDSIFISNGKIFWDYDSTVNQVSIMCLNDVISLFPISIITETNLNSLDNYDIKRNGDHFYIYEKSNNKNWKKISIEITNIGIIKNIEIKENNSQNVTYRIFLQDRNYISKNKFCFCPNNKVLLDDQRTK